jgi:hypothetical protein
MPEYHGPARFSLDLLTLHPVDIAPDVDQPITSA